MGDEDTTTRKDFRRVHSRLDKISTDLATLSGACAGCRTQVAANAEDLGGNGRPGLKTTVPLLEQALTTLGKRVTSIQEARTRYFYIVVGCVATMGFTLIGSAITHIVSKLTN